MKAVTWQGKRNVSVETVPDPRIQEANDAIIEVTTTNICGSDLHLYELLSPFMTAGDILGHEPMGIVREIGSDVGDLAVGDRVVIPFQISCGHCAMCGGGLQTQCETTQVRSEGTGAALFRIFEALRQCSRGAGAVSTCSAGAVHAHQGPGGPSDDRFVYLSDVLPTAWQAVEYAGVREGESLTVLGLGPIGDMAARIAAHRGVRVIGVDLVPERLERLRARGIEVLDLRRTTTSGRRSGT